jgi:hypothetical protein
VALTLRVKAGRATFAITDGAMKAEWTLTTDMSEEEIFDALLGMMRYVRQQPAVDIRPPLHVVPDLPDVIHVQNLTADGPASERPAMTWAPAIQPKPLDASLEAAGANGFELIPDDELD